MNKIKPILMVVLFPLLGSHSHAQELNYTGPNSQALANIRAIDHSVWAVLNNASGTAYQKNTTLAASYGNLYSIKELSSRTLIFLYPSQSGTFSSFIQQSGYSKSQYTQYALSYSRLFGRNYAAFLQFHYINHHIEGADKGEGFYSSLGMLIKTTKAIQVGIFVQNPEQNNIKYANENYKLPTFFNVGLEWYAGWPVSIMAEVEKQLGYATNYKAAAQFGFKQCLFVRTGINGKPGIYTFGAGFVLKQLQIDTGFSYHQQLGISSGIGISYSFNKKKSKQ